MLRRRANKTDSADASAFSRRATIADSLWTVQDRARTSCVRAARAIGGGAGRLVFAFERKLVWPLGQRAAGAGAPARAASFGIVVVLAAAAGVGALVWAAPDQPQRTVATEVAATAPAAPETAPQAPPRPTLHGAAPVFEPAHRTANSEVDPAKAIVKSSPRGSTATAQEGSNNASSAPTSSAATASDTARTAAVDGPPAGPAAISVAHNFADAFVVYETGGLDGTVRRAFGQTATPQLSRALLKRPPRLPASVKVPKAKVLNIVPAPSSGETYPVSVSLLRVGVTSELRLEMEKLKGDGWRVVNVLG